MRMKTKLLTLLLSSFIAVAIYYVGWSALSNVLFPGFYLSAILTVRDHASFGKAYVLTGLALNVVIFSVVGLLLLRAITWARFQRAKRLR
jgi:hypothetical protein